MDERMEQVIAELNQVGFDPLLQRVRGSYRIDVEGQSSWRLEVDDGSLHGEPCDADADADCVLALDIEDAPLVFRGELNLLIAFMQGRVHLSGNAVMAQRLHAFLRARRPATQPGAGATL